MAREVLQVSAASRRCAALALALAAALAAAGCSTGTGTRPPSEPTHQTRAARLREVMRGFDTAIRSDVPGQTDLHDRWEGVFPAIADAAAGLEASAIQLSGRPPDGLELPDRGRYQVLARSLAEAAHELADAAGRGDADGVQVARARVSLACQDCHERYRPDSPGVPDAFR